MLAGDILEFQLDIYRVSAAEDQPFLDQRNRISAAARRQLTKRACKFGSFFRFHLEASIDAVNGRECESSGNVNLADER